MWSELCQPHHLLIIIIVLVLALIATGAGKGGGKLLLQLLKKLFGHEEININLGGGDMAGKPGKECEACGVFPDPKKCPLHQSEHERSLRNEEQIAKILTEYGKLRDETLAAQNKLKDEMVAVFDKVNASIANSNTVILGALAGTRAGFGKPGRGGGD
jgi:hypothetical protein